MDAFVKEFGFIVFVVLLVLGVSMTLGRKVTYGFLWLVLASMLVVGWPKIRARMEV
jgi:hypothetical protein